MKAKAMAISERAKGVRSSQNFLGSRVGFGLKVLEKGLASGTKAWRDLRLKGLRFWVLG